MEAFNLAQLTKEIVVEQLSNLADPVVLAAETVRGTLVARLKGHRLSNYEIQEAVSEVCQGGVTALILKECPLGRGAGLLLGAAENAAKEAGLDVELVSIAAVRGLSDARRFVSGSELREMRTSLEGVRLGAGASFDRFCVDLRADQSHPDYVPPSL